MERFISKENLENFDKDFHSSRENIIAMNAVTANGLKEASKNWRAKANDIHQYSIRLDNKGVTNQKSSGRCWMFAALNCMRFAAIKKMDLDKFEFSQNFTCFYDKLEKANYFLENILATLDEDVEGRIVSHLLQSPVQDGGQWDMISAIITKYGLVPKEVMDESACSSGTKEMNAIVTEKLREFACILRKEHESGKSLEELREIKTGMVETIYRMLAICLGQPPERFDYSVRTKSGEYITEKGITPKEFYDKYVGIDLSQYISVINATTEDKPFMKSYTVKYLGNVVGAPIVRYVNLPIEELKNAAIAQMKDGEPVWFGCDVGQHSERVSGVMDLNTYDYESVFNTTFNMTKADRLEYGHSKMTHAMVFQGVDLDENGKPVRWCVENSWGEDRGVEGMYFMTDERFDQYMYQVVVNKKYLSDEIVAAYESEPVVLDPWDPMGALAD